MIIRGIRVSPATYYVIAVAFAWLMSIGADLTAFLVYSFIMIAFVGGLRWIAEELASGTSYVKQKMSGTAEPEPVPEPDTALLAGLMSQPLDVSDYGVSEWSRLEQLQNATEEEVFIDFCCLRNSDGGWRYSKNKLIQMFGGNRQQTLQEIDKIRAEAPAMYRKVRNGQIWYEVIGKDE